MLGYCVEAVLQRVEAEIRFTRERQEYPERYAGEADDGPLSVWTSNNNKMGTGANGNDAVALYAEHAPDIALLDIQMPGRDGLSAAREILEHDPAARVVFLTTFSDDEYIVSALKLGARGYLIKTDVAAIPPALAQVMDGKRVLEDKAIEDVDFDGANAEADATRRPAAFAGLTDREFEVAELIARGLDNKEIAATAYMGEGTVRNHISSILAKMGLRNRTQIAIAYLRG